MDTGYLHTCLILISLSLFWCLTLLLWPFHKVIYPILHVSLPLLFALVIAPMYLSFIQYQNVSMTVFSESQLFNTDTIACLLLSVVWSYWCIIEYLVFVDKRRREDIDSPDMFSDLYSSSADDLPSMATSQAESTSSSRKYRSSSVLTNIKSKPASQSAVRKTESDGKSSSTQGLMSPFRTFILSEGDSLFDSDPSAWGDISSFDKNTLAAVKSIPLSKLTSPGTTGKP